MADIQPNVVVSMLSQQFTMPNKFASVFNGKIYIGKIDTDPRVPANQIQVYLENEDGSHVPVPQPLRTNAAGFPVYNGQISKFVTVEGQSMLVTDANGSQLFYFPNVLKYDPDQFRLILSGPGGAAMVGTSSGGTVQEFIDGISTTIVNNFPWVSPEKFGAVGDGVADDRLAWQQAADSKLNIRCRNGAKYKLGATVIFPDNTPTLIDGNGCEIVWNTAMDQPFDQYSISPARVGYTNFKSYQNMKFSGPVLPKSRFSDYAACHAINFANGFARDITANGFTNVFRAFGNTYMSNITADNIRNSIMSDRNNNNHIENVKVGWCAGDVIVFYSQFSTANNITAEYAGVIPANTEEAPGTPRGSLISTGQDGNADNCKYINISNVQCKYHGGGGIIAGGESINIGGVINVGDVYQATALTSARQLAVWVSGNRINIGDVFCGAVNVAVTFQSGSSNCSVGDVFVASNLVGTAASLLSAFDATPALITNCSLRSIVMEGFVNTGNAAVISSSGMIVGEIVIRSVGNVSANRTILLRGASKVGKISIYNPGASSATATTLELQDMSGSPYVNEIEFDGLFGNNILVAASCIPKLGDIFLRSASGSMRPIVINNDGTGNFFWGSVRLNGSFSIGPALNGNLSMTGFYSPFPWVSNNAGLPAVVKFPTQVTTTLS